MVIKQGGIFKILKLSDVKRTTGEKVKFYDIQKEKINDSNSIRNQFCKAF